MWSPNSRDGLRAPTVRFWNEADADRRAGTPEPTPMQVMFQGPAYQSHMQEMLYVVVP